MSCQCWRGSFFNLPPRIVTPVRYTPNAWQRHSGFDTAVLGQDRHALRETPRHGVRLWSGGAAAAAAAGTRLKIKLSTPRMNPRIESERVLLPAVFVEYNKSFHTPSHGISHLDLSNSRTCLIKAVSKCLPMTQSPRRTLKWATMKE